MGKIILYGELARRAGVKEIKVSTQGKKLIDILREIAEKYDLKDIMFKNERLRPLFLIMIEGADYFSLRRLNEQLNEEKEIKIIPIFHGGAVPFSRIPVESVYI